MLLIKDRRKKQQLHIPTKVVNASSDNTVPKCLATIVNVNYYTKHYLELQFIFDFTNQCSQNQEDRQIC